MSKDNKETLQEESKEAMKKVLDKEPSESLWQKVCTTDPAFTKPFNRGGGFSGTAINSTYLVRRASQLFGPLGIGWGYDVIEERLIEGHPLNAECRTLIHVLRLKLWYEYGDARGEVIHFGQTTMVGSNRYGLFTDEEAPKKSLTDALTKCLSMLGFSADIYLGLYDDNGYVSDLRRELKQDKTPITARDRGVLEALVEQTNTDLASFLEFFGESSLKTFGKAQLDRAMAMLNKKLKMMTKEGQVNGN